MISKFNNSRKLFSTSSSTVVKSVSIVQLPYNVLVNHKSDDALEIIDRAYSDNGIGSLAISGIPGYTDKRKRTLFEAWKLANLPKDQREKLERPEHFYQVGWEHGEYGFIDGRDAYMGSFFSNPLRDTFIGEDGNEWQNAWPEDDLPSLRPAVQDLSLTMKSAALHLAKHMDKYVQEHLPSFQPQFFSSIVQNTQKVNSRLIHYYPCNQDFTGQWTGWHKDIGMLTCLTPALYTDSKGQEINYSDPNVGLHGQTKDGSVIKINVPKECMIVQIGEALEVKTGGFIKALPHAVIPYKPRDPSEKAISRNSMALFIDPDHENSLDIPAERSESQLFQCDTTIGLLTPKLQGRWFKGDTYGDFYLRSLAAYKQPGKNLIGQ